MDDIFPVLVGVIVLVLPITCFLLAIFVSIKVSKIHKQNKKILEILKKEQTS